MNSKQFIFFLFAILIIELSISLQVQAACTVPTTVGGGGAPSPVIAGTNNLSVGNNSYITGSTGTLYTSGNGTSLTTTNGVGPPGQSLPAFLPTTFPPVGTVNRTVNNNTLVAGSYKDVTISGSSTFSGGNYYISELKADNNVTLTLAAGDYFVDKWDVGNNFVLAVSSGPVRIFINTKFEAGQQSVFNTSGSTANLQIYAYNNAQLQFGEANNGNSNVDFNGLIYAPGSNTQIQFGNNNIIQGSVLSGGTIDLGNNTGVIFDAATQSAIGSIVIPGVICALSTDHYQLSLASTGVTCLTTPVTVTACANSSSPCTSIDTSVSGTATLATSGATLASTTVTFSAGVANTTLSYPLASDGTSTSVSLANESVAANNARQCCVNGTSCSVANSCAITFNTAGFIFSNAADGAVATIPSQIAGTTSSTYYLRAVKTNTTTKACESALTGTQSINFAYECNNPTACSISDLLNVNATAIARNNNGSVSSYLPVTMTFDINGNAPFTFDYGDVGLIKLYASKAAAGTLLTTLTGLSNAFVVKPDHFSIDAIKQTAAPQLVNPAAASATDAIFVKAGEAFTATVTAMTSTNATTPNFGKETAAEGVILTRNLVLPSGGATGTLSNASILGGNFSNGIATVTNLTWDEVGIITLTPSIADADYLGVGDVIGITTATIGRFIPDHFAVTTLGTATPACGNFTYFGQDGFSTAFTLTAQNVANATTQNYTGLFAKLGLTTWSNFGFTTLASLPAGSTFTASSTAPTGSWTNGIAPITAKHQVSRPTAPVGETAVTVQTTPLDSDGVTMTAAVVAPSTPLRYGRLSLQNAYGSELLDLPMPLTAQYWNGNAWVINPSDQCTTDISLSLTDPNLTDGLISSELCAWDTGVGTGNSGLGCAVAGSSSLQFKKPPVAGNFNLNWKATGAGNNGFLDVTATIPSYLQFNWRGTGNSSPTARATFGIYKGNDKQIYFRELY